MVSATNGLYWGFHNIQCWRHGLSCLYDNGSFSEDLVFLIPCISCTPILEDKFLSKECGLYTRKYGNLLIISLLLLFSLSLHCYLQELWILHYHTGFVSFCHLRCISYGLDLSKECWEQRHFVCCYCFLNVKLLECTVLTLCGDSHGCGKIESCLNKPDRNGMRY
jgi:hypothetical protein